MIAYLAQKNSQIGHHRLAQGSAPPAFGKGCPLV